MKLIAQLAIVASLTACSSQPTATRDAFNRQADRLLGSDISNVISRIGEPTKTFTLPNGNTVYSFIRGRKEIEKADPLDLLLDPLNAGVRKEVVHYCRLDLTVDSGSQKVMFQRSEGDLCVAKPPQQTPPK